MPITLDPVQSGYNLSVINDNFQRIENTWDEKLDRITSTQGNPMEQELDMNSNHIINNPAPTDETHLVRLKELEEVAYDLSPRGVIPIQEPRQTGNGSNKVFSAPNDVDVSAATMLVRVDGVVQRAFTDYDVTGINQITFTNAPANNTAVDIMWFEPNILENPDVSLRTAKATGTSEARTLGDRFADVVNVKDFGAVGDGVTDDTDAFQSAIDAGGLIYIPAAVYKINGTLTMRSNVKLYGEPGTSFLGMMTPEGSGGYPNQMIYANGVNNISFENILFDFNKRGYNYEFAAGLTSVNSVYMINTNDVSFNNCEFFDFVTNGDPADFTSKAFMNFAVAQFDTCLRLDFNNFKLNNIREEGPHFYRCKDVTMSNVSGNGSVVNTSSFAGFWYCNGVTLRDADFIHTGGSLVNCWSANVVFDNIQCNVGLAPNGRGFGIENEADLEIFDVHNISITNCALFVKQYAINGTIVPNQNRIEQFNIENNYFQVIEDAGVHNGVRLSSPNGCSVKNNRIHIVDSGLATPQGTAINISLEFTTSPPEDFTTMYDIESNVIYSSLGVAISNQQAGDCYLAHVSIKDNVWYATGLNGGTTYSGNSSFMFYRDFSAASGSVVIGYLNVSGNLAYDVEGSLIRVSQDSGTLSIDHMLVSDNVFKGADTGTSSFISTALNAGILDAKVLDNHVINGGRSFIFNTSELTYRNNVHIYETEFTAQRLSLNSVNGLVRITDNIWKNITTSQFDIQDTGTQLMVDVTGNCSLRADNSLVFSTNLVNSTLPN